jgi:hypothetical protein
MSKVNGVEVEVLEGKNHPALQGTYFRSSDVLPQMVDGKLQIVDGRGYGASWGCSQVTSKISALTEDVIMVNVVGWHKHTVSPVGGNYYFVNENGKWMRRRANHKRVKAVLN